MRYAKIRETDIDNAPGICASLFVQGCSHHCNGCFNSDTWNFDKGELFTKDIFNQFIEIASREYIKNICILGGEPLDQDLNLLELIKSLKTNNPNKDIWLWTGYRYEEIFAQSGFHELNKIRAFQREIIHNIDYLVDGPFIQELADKNLRFYGSSNQRVIDIKNTIKEGKIILREE